jgi:hypothetical protein
MMLPAQRVYPDRIEVIDDHPDTGERFSGLALPFYREAVEVAVKAQGALSQLRTLGFDVAITERGVSIIEANTWWGHPTQAEMRRGLITDKLREVLDVIIPPM